MRDDVLDAHFRALYQFRIEEDTLLGDLAGAPVLFQALVDDLGLWKAGINFSQKAVVPHLSLACWR